MTHLAQITLQTTDIYNVSERLAEIKEIKDWIDELVHWQLNQYELRFLSSSRTLMVWFEDEKHATLCKIKWP